MNVMFLDESGDHSLSTIDHQYPLFLLGGVIVDKDYAENVVTERVCAFKRSLFGNENFILHSADIARNRNGFERLVDAGFRAEFYLQLNKLMSELEYKVVACAIRKDVHLVRYGIAALDPYMLSLDVLVERFCFEIGTREDAGVIVVEKRGATLDQQLELAWLNLKIQGTRYISASDIRRRISGITTRSKSENIAGLQLADLVLSPIGRYELGKAPKEDFRIVEQKFRTDHDGNYHGYGLVVLPRE